MTDTPRSLARSPAVDIPGVDAVDVDGSGKRVAHATLRLEERHGPTPPRRLVAIETQDGATYRFQRYTPSEPLVFDSRENPDGTAFTRDARLPAHVAAVRDAIQAGSLQPRPHDRELAHAAVRGDTDSVTATRTGPATTSVATDGGHCDPPDQ